MAGCEVKVWGDWKRLTLDQALELDASHLKRCPECLGDSGQRLAGTAALDGFGALIIAELALPAELHTVGHRALAALAGAFPDQVTLEVGNGGKQGR
jgi:hypothetical protein